ncbi:MAG: hypothetical protein ACYTEK_20640 [Planctomycetota bacterium]
MFQVFLPISGFDYTPFFDWGQAKRKAAPIPGGSGVAIFEEEGEGQQKHLSRRTEPEGRTATTPPRACTGEPEPPAFLLRAFRFLEVPLFDYTVSKQYSTIFVDNARINATKH